MEEREYYLGFCLAPGIGPKRFASLLKNFKTAKNAWKASSLSLKNAGLGSSVIADFQEFKKSFDCDKYKHALKSASASFVALCDKDYPKLLKQIADPPAVLFYKGNFKSINFENTIAVVGTRKITNYGKEITQLFSGDLVQAGYIIVSGLAIGVDAVAAWSAINNDGKTVAVLGSGVDLGFPPVNKPLYDKILEGNGVLISQFPLSEFFDCG